MVIKLREAPTLLKGSDSGVCIFTGILLMQNGKLAKMVQRFILACGMLISCCALLSCSKNDDGFPLSDLPAPVVGKTYSAAEIASFKQMSLRASSDMIVKLPTRVAVYLVDTTYPYLTRELDSVIRQINQLLDTNLIISRTQDYYPTKIRVYLTDRETYMQKEPATRTYLQNTNYTGYAHITWGNEGTINYGSAFVDMVRSDRDSLAQCYILHHEIMHTLGLLGHVSQTQFYSVLFASPTLPYITRYTPFDNRMMLLLYNPAVKPGMKEAVFDSVVKDL